MPGMFRHLQTDNPVVTSAFRVLITRQMLIVAAVLSVFLLASSVFRALRLRRALNSAPDWAPVARPSSEPAARRILRIGFALLWILDGALQLQPAMPLGLSAIVLKPAAASSPDWVQHLVNFAVTTWTNHPVEAAVSAVWIQIGLGVLLLVAPRGRWSRFAGLASLGWGLVVWVFGEAFGGIFAPGLSWLFGAPGAALFYCLAGALLAMPERSFASRKLGQWLLRAMGAFFVGMATLQAWPGRGFWRGARAHGGPHGASGPLLSMVRQMAETPQPRAISSWLGSFASFDAAHGWGVNLFVVAVLACIGIALGAARPGTTRLAVVAAAVLGLADWVLVQDFGFLGGVGTDPNSMLPTMLVLVSAYVAIVRVPSRATSPAISSRASPLAVPAGPRSQGSAGAGKDRRGSWRQVQPAYFGRVLASVGALGLLVLGAAPMAVASSNPNADPILALAVDGNPTVVNLTAPVFHLIDQAGRPVTLASLRGRTVALTFLDPVCTSVCPVIAQEFREADALLGSNARRAVFVAIVANPVYRSTAFTRAFDRQEGLGGLSNWLFLTGTAPALTRVWNEYGVQVAVPSAGAMLAHSDIAYLIDASGRALEVLSTTEGTASADQSSFAVLLSQQMRRIMTS